VARSRSKAYQAIADLVEKTVGTEGKVKIAYVHAAAAEEALRLKGLVESRVRAVESLIAELSPALGVHSGPGTAGVCFFPVSEYVSCNRN
jgi:fatty acid-binding protein DegV